MKVRTPPVIAAVAVVADQVQFDCPACGETHVLFRALDYDEEHDGTWRTRERPGHECDCGVLIQADFRIMPQREDGP